MPVTGRTSDQQLNLEVERLRTESFWRSLRTEDVPMSIAAARIFHEVHRTARATVSRTDYEDALNITASALSRVVPVYTIASRKRVEIRFSPVTHRYLHGATQLRSMDGIKVGELFVQHRDMLRAIPIIKRAGLPLSPVFAA